MTDRELELALERPDRPREECGVVGISGHSEAAHHAYLALYALQHRGKESAGIATRNGSEMHVHKAMGLVPDIFDDETLRGLPGRHAVGHVRYSTSGASVLRDAQPILAHSGGVDLALAHNGNLTNAGAIRSELEGLGSIFQSSMDSEVFVHLFARTRGSLVERLSDTFSRVRGAYSLVMMVDDVLIAARDPHGFRPLSLGRLDSAWVVASETCAFDLIGATFERDVEPGEIIVIRRGRLRSLQPLPKVPERLCIFEHIYFARPDSQVYGATVYQTRKQLGRELARESPVEADMVVPVLDSGAIAALGYAEEAGLPYEPALIRNHFVGRTFIEPEQSIRHFGVRIKHNAIREVIENKRIVLVEDSIVRGTTLTKLVPHFRAAGPREIHVRVAAPPTTHPCYYGIDMPTREELIASSRDVAEIARTLGADSLAYLSLDAMRRVGATMKRGFCDACFSGDYVIPVEEIQAVEKQIPLFGRSSARGRAAATAHAATTERRARGRPSS